MKEDNRKALPMWDGWSRARRGVPVYDPWLKCYNNYLERVKEEPILDLGCGIGANTRYLIENGYRVVAADYSKEALSSVAEFIPEAETRYLDMNERFPFENAAFSAIVADLSLHYFDTETTVHIMREIWRILKPGGFLLARVSSMNDTYYGAGSGREIEPHFYDHGSYAQRYFNEDDLLKFFGMIGRIRYQEMAMTRDEAYYSHPKMLYRVRAEKA